jgi:transcriptional regulator with XRE-family HTH domain
MPRSAREPVPNLKLYNVRDARGETQEQTAQALNGLARERGLTTPITGNHVSRWERGVVHPSRLYCQLLAEHFGATLAELGLARQRVSPTDARPAGDGGPTELLLIEDAEQMEVDQRVIDSQREWLGIRRSLNRHHLGLAQTAAQLYPESSRMVAAGLLIRPEWMWPHPANLDSIKLTYDVAGQSPQVTGTEDFTSQTRPLRADGQRYQRYSHAIRDIAQPTLFENHYSWRLLQVKLSDDGGELRFGDMNYFDAMDTCEAIAHETAAAHVLGDGTIGAASWRGLRYRKAIGDPFDLARRAVLLSINTLTIRRDRNTASIVLHNRNAANVATSGGIIGVMPAGVFQPSTVRTSDHTADFDLWRNIMREYSEEFLGAAEHDGDGPGADYTVEPFRTLEAARLSGAVRIHVFGIALGALDLWAGLETVAVFDADVFDEVFAAMVRVNDEGTVVRVGRGQPSVHVPFTEAMIDELWSTGRLAPETAYSLRTAWKHRDLLLAAS